MNAPTSIHPFLAKALESLAGAESEFVNARYNNCANRCYYACFQAAIHALLQAGVRPSGDQWGHDFVQARFVGLLINRRKMYPVGLRDVLQHAFALRQIADYQANVVGQRRTERTLKAAREFVDTISRAERGYV